MEADGIDLLVAGDVKIIGVNNSLHLLLHQFLHLPVFLEQRNVLMVT